MAQNMKISVVKPTGENIIITVNENELFLEVQSKILKEHNVCLSTEHFAIGFNSVAENDNLHNYLKEHFVNDNANDLSDGKPVYEINLLDKSNSQITNTVVKCENNSPYVINEDSDEHYNVYKEVQNLDTSLMVLNQEQTSEFSSELTDNLFESAVYEQATNIKTEENNQGITLYGADDSVLMTEDYQLLETDSVPKTSEPTQDKVEPNSEPQNTVDLTSVLSTDDVEKDMQSDQGYNYMDIESKLREIHDYSEESMTDLCRLCAGNLIGVNKVLIYDESSVSDKLEEKINGSLPVKVVREDGLPQQLCDSCVSRVKTFHEFVQVVTEADKVLRLKFKITETVNDSLKENSVSEFISEFLSSPAAETITDQPPCHICGKNLNRLSRLRKHLLTHESNPVVNDVHVCKLCKETFAGQQNATVHQACQHANEKCIEVISTDKVFRSHTGHTPYMCHICKAHFSSYSRCTTHKTTHGLYKDGAEKDNYPVIKHFLCEHCGKSYLHWTYLVLHRRLKHSDVVHMYKCTACNLEFPTSWGLAYHRKSKHSAEQFKCGDCGKCLSNYHSLKLHQMTQHCDKKNKDIQCEKCGKIFVHQNSLEAHMKLHQGIKEYKCSFCPKTFVHPSGLSNHVKVHKSRKHVYGSKLILPKQDEDPIRIGNVDRPFNCDICGLAFRREFTLRNHRFKHAQVSEAGSFVLMVDMKEDEAAETNKPKEPMQAPVQEKQDVPMQEPTITQITNENGLAENYIDIGNGNYLQVQGNTFNIGGKEYILVDENGKSINRNHEFEMIVDETLREDEPAEVANNMVTGQQFGENQIMLVESGVFNLITMLCVQESKHLIDIFKHINKLNPESISKYIQHYFDVDIKQDDPHSRCICASCWCLLDLIIKKRNKFKENDNKLRDEPVERKQALPHIQEHPGLLLSESVKQIFAENACINLPAKYWLMNFDVQVDLSTSKLSMDYVKRSSEYGSDNTLVEMFCNGTEKTELTNNSKMKRKRASCCEMESSRSENKTKSLKVLVSRMDHELRTK
ncbi:Meiotic central spindle [Carabus blaptoides fortunei]